MTAFYNEHDPMAAAWLRELIAGGQIAPGTVDERDIRDIRPDELAGYTQCHFFGGIGGWSRALRLAGWPDDRPVWTGSCPCQPFSAAGKRAGFDDERHLWPAWFHLIGQCRPDVVFGEQVAGAAGLVWFDLVSADLEGAQYAVGAANLCAAGVGAPHRRQRLWFVAHAQQRPAERWGYDLGTAPGSLEGGAQERQLVRADAGTGSDAGGLAHADGRHSGDRGVQRSGQHGLQPQDGDAGGPVGDAPGGGLGIDGRAPGDAGHPDQSNEAGGVGESEGERSGRRSHNDHARRWERASADSSPLGGFWAGAEWLPCTDGKARPVEPGTFPLASGVPVRVGRLRGYGNAIVPQVAAAFIRAADTGAGG